MEDLNCILCLDDSCQNETDSSKGLHALVNYLLISIKDYDDLSSCSVCVECQTLLEKFIDLLQLLEIAKMKVDSCVRQISEVMLEGNKFESDKEKFKQGSFRERIMNKTIVEAEKLQPTIRLHRNQFITYGFANSKITASLKPVPLETKSPIKSEPVEIKDDLMKEPHLAHSSEVLPMPEPEVIEPVPVECKVEIKTEPFEDDVSYCDNISEIELGELYTEVKSEEKESEIESIMDAPETIEWECCRCDNSPTGNPAVPVLYYNIDCLKSQTSKIKVPHLMCNACKCQLGESLPSEKKMCPKCGNSDTWNPDNIRKLHVPHSLMRALKHEKRIENEIADIRIDKKRKASDAERVIIDERLSKLESESSFIENEQKNQILEEEVVQYLGKHKPWLEAVKDQDEFVTAFKLVNDYEQDWIYRINWTILQKLKLMKNERIKWRKKNEVEREMSSTWECPFCLKEIPSNEVAPPTYSLDDFEILETFEKSNKRCNDVVTNTVPDKIRKIFENNIDTVAPVLPHYATTLHLPPPSPQLESELN